MPRKGQHSFYLSHTRTKGRGPRAPLPLFIGSSLFGVDYARLKIGSSLFHMGSASRVASQIPTGFRPQSPGCEERATLGNHGHIPNLARGCVHSEQNRSNSDVVLKGSVQRRAFRDALMRAAEGALALRNLFEVEAMCASTQGSSFVATLGFADVIPLG